MKNRHLRFLSCLALFAIGVSSCSVAPSGGGGDDPELVKKQREIYQLAVSSGYEGTYEEWLNSIRGENGSMILFGEGAPSSNIGKAGDGYLDTSTWDVYFRTTSGWQKMGNIMGREGQPGKDGDTPYIGDNGNWWIGNKDTGVKAQGSQGDPGKDGKSAYELYCEAHPEYKGDEKQWLDDLINGRLGNKESHTVTFNTNGGSTIENQTVLHGEKISKPNDPVRDGYVFEGWTYQGEPWVFFGYVVTEDMTLDANWSILTYSIKYNLNGGSSSESYPTTYTVEDEIEFLNPYKEGYVFEGWTVNDEPFTKIEKGTTGDLLLVANWSTGSYTVEVQSLDESKGLVVGGGTFEYNTPVTVYAIPKENYEFIGWFTSDQLINNVSNDTIYSFNMPSLSITLYALFMNKEDIHSEDELEFEVDEGGGQCYVRGLKEGSEVHDLIIPKTYNGYPVTRICDGAFRDCNSLASVVIPNSVTEIDGFAFEHCDSLELVSMPNSIQRIWFGAFIGCRSLKRIFLSRSVREVDDFVFEGCDNLIIYCETKSQTEEYRESWNWYCTVVYGQIETVGGYSYLISDGEATVVDCSDNIDEFDPPSIIDGAMVTDINWKIFRIHQFTSIVIPDCITEIPDYAFEHSASLTKVKIGKNVSSIQPRTFEKCPSLVEFIVNENNKYFSSVDGVLFSKDLTSVVKYPCGKEGNYSIPDSVTTICDCAFSDCLSLTSLVIPDSVITIGEAAFNSCSNIESITFGANVKIIGKFSFQSCYSLTSIIIPDSVTTIGEAAFNDCTSLSVVILGNGVNEIGGGAFASCQLLQYNVSGGLCYLGNNNNPYLALFRPKDDSQSYYEINRSCKIICGGAFAGYSSFSSIIIPSSIVSVGDYAFYDCENLLEATFESENPPLIGSDIFGSTWDNEDFKIRVPYSGLEKYKSITAPYWQNYAVKHIIGY